MGTTFITRVEFVLSLRLRDRNSTLSRHYLIPFSSAARLQPKTSKLFPRFPSTSVLTPDDGDRTDPGLVPTRNPSGHTPLSRRGDLFSPLGTIGTGVVVGGGTRRLYSDRGGSPTEVVTIFFLVTSREVQKTTAQGLGGGVRGGVTSVVLGVYELKDDIFLHQ